MKNKAIPVFLFRLLLFLIVLFLVDNLLGWGLKKMYFSQYKGQIAQTTYAIDSTNQAILIFGSSRAVRQYSPTILTKETKLSCYNAGRDAEKIPYYTAIQEVALQRSHPKLIILDVNPNELIVDNTKYLKLSLLLPYCESHPELIKYIEEISPFEKYKLISKTYPYNSLLFIMVSDLLFANEIHKDDEGYQPLIGSMTKQKMESIIARKKAFDEREKRERRTKIDPKSVKYYKAFLQRTQQLHIKTLVVISPSLISESETLRSQLKGISQVYSNITFLDFTGNPNYTQQNEKFSDMFHLNKKGAEEFSNELANYLKKEKLVVTP